MKILLVDDERTEREGIRFLIEKFQFELEVAEAANGKLAMEYLQKSQDWRDTTGYDCRGVVRR